jgi:hypothetical protein
LRPGRADVSASSQRQGVKIPQLDMVMNTYNPNTQEAETGRLRVPGKPGQDHVSKQNKQIFKNPNQYPSLKTLGRRNPLLFREGVSQLSITTAKDLTQATYTVFS